MKVETINDLECKIGGNADENWKILSESSQDNLFFHLSSFPSCYVIYNCNKENYPYMNIIKQIAEVCKNNTKYKNLKNIKVDFTLCSNVVKGDKVGEVIYKSNRQVKQIKL